MGEWITVTDLGMPELEVYTSLTDTRLRSKLEPEKGVLIAESPKVIRLALAAGWQPLSFLMERQKAEGPARELLAEYPEVPVYTGERQVLAALTGYTLTRGVLCAMRRKPLPTVEEVCAGARRLAEL